jgi:hypothetical protein
MLQIHELIDGISNKDMYTTDFAFRLIFNGKILTPLVPGCPLGSELCDAAVLKKLVDPISTRNPDCSLRIPVAVATTSPKEAIAKAHTLLKTTEGIIMFVGIVMFGILVGACGTFVVLTGRLPCSTTRVLATNAVDEDEEARRGLQASSSYSDDDLSDEDEQDSADAADRIDDVPTGLP